MGTETSARNSEVIHAGIYYAKGTNKAKLCRQGRDMLYDYCQSHGVVHKRLGKLIVATEAAHVLLLDGIRAKAEANGVSDLRPLSAAEAIGIEPNLHCAGALLSPSTGIVDSHGLMLAYQGDAETRGAMIAFMSPLVGGQVTKDGIVIRAGGAEPMELLCTTVVNAAGHGAQPAARAIQGIPAETIPGQYFARGVYFTLAGKSPFERLIYPVPDPAGGLGVHITIDLGNQAKFGPDVEWIDGVEYTVDPKRGDKFYAAIRTYWPGLADGALQPGYAGVRPKTFPKGTETDFIIQGPDVHGVKGLVNLYGIESPGLTSSLAIAQEVSRLLAG
ncbi:MAG: NAD(P)/FAD-dependent oxidoreductase [Proteobacteria bacterium]|nr:NAD(P)/FAD-dependent oxidoreductase [Pseudomonadota bacterium]